MKVQSTKDQMIEYYIKMCQDHPLLTYIEDPFGDNDMDSYRRF